MKATVLLVEDDQVNAFIVHKFLAQDFEIIHANSADEALILGAKHHEAISLILMDINLGHEFMGGIEVLKILREIDSLSYVPAIAVTAYAALGDREKFLAAGFNHYVSKPIDKRGLIKNIHFLIGSVA